MDQLLESISGAIANIVTIANDEGNRRLVGVEQGVDAVVRQMTVFATAAVNKATAWTADHADLRLRVTHYTHQLSRSVKAVRATALAVSADPDDARAKGRLAAGARLLLTSTIKIFVCDDLHNTRCMLEQARAIERIVRDLRLSTTPEIVGPRSTELVQSAAPRMFQHLDAKLQAASSPAHIRQLCDARKALQECPPQLLGAVLAVLQNPADAAAPAARDAAARSIALAARSAVQAARDASREAFGSIALDLDLGDAEADTLADIRAIADGAAALTQAAALAAAGRQPVAARAALQAMRDDADKAAALAGELSRVYGDAAQARLLGAAQHALSMRVADMCQAAVAVVTCSAGGDADADLGAAGAALEAAFAALAAAAARLPDQIRAEEASVQAHLEEAAAAARRQDVAEAVQAVRSAARSISALIGIAKESVADLLSDSTRAEPVVAHRAGQVADACDEAAVAVPALVAAVREFSTSPVDGGLALEASVHSASRAVAALRVKATQTAAEETLDAAGRLALASDLAGTREGQRSLPRLVNVLAAESATLADLARFYFGVVGADAEWQARLGLTSVERLEGASALRVDLGAPGALDRVRKAALDLADDAVGVAAWSAQPEREASRCAKELIAALDPVAIALRERNPAHVSRALSAAQELACRAAVVASAVALRHPRRKRQQQRLPDCARRLRASASAALPDACAAAADAGCAGEPMERLMDVLDDLRELAAAVAGGADGVPAAPELPTAWDAFDNTAALDLSMHALCAALAGTDARAARAAWADAACDLQSQIDTARMLGPSALPLDPARAILVPQASQYLAILLSALRDVVASVLPPETDDLQVLAPSPQAEADARGIAAAVRAASVRVPDMPLAAVRIASEISELRASSPAAVEAAHRLDAYARQVARALAVYAELHDEKTRSVVVHTAADLVADASALSSVAAPPPEAAVLRAQRSLGRAIPPEGVAIVTASAVDKALARYSGAADDAEARAALSDATRVLVERQAPLAQWVAAIAKCPSERLSALARDSAAWTPGQQLQLPAVQDARDALLDERTVGAHAMRLGAHVARSLALIEGAAAGGRRYEALCHALLASEQTLHLTLLCLCLSRVVCSRASDLAEVSVGLLGARSELEASANDFVADPTSGDALTALAAACAEVRRLVGAIVPLPAEFARSAEALEAVLARIADAMRRGDYEGARRIHETELEALLAHHANVAAMLEASGGAQGEALVRMQALSTRIAQLEHTIRSGGRAGEAFMQPALRAQILPLIGALRDDNTRAICMSTEELAQAVAQSTASVDGLIASYVAAVQAGDRAAAMHAVETLEAALVHHAVVSRAFAARSACANDHQRRAIERRAQRLHEESVAAVADLRAALSDMSTAATAAEVVRLRLAPHLVPAAEHTAAQQQRATADAALDVCAGLDAKNYEQAVAAAERLAQQSAASCAPEALAALRSAAARLSSERSAAAAEALRGAARCVVLSSCPEARLVFVSSAVAVERAAYALGNAVRSGAAQEVVDDCADALHDAYAELEATCIVACAAEGHPRGHASSALDAVALQMALVEASYAAASTDAQRARDTEAAARELQQAAADAVAKTLPRLDVSTVDFAAATARALAELEAALPSAESEALATRVSQRAAALAMVCAASGREESARAGRALVVTCRALGGQVSEAVVLASTGASPSAALAVVDASIAEARRQIAQAAPSDADRLLETASACLCFAGAVETVEYREAAARTASLARVAALESDREAAVRVDACAVQLEAVRSADDARAAAARLVAAAVGAGDLHRLALAEAEALRTALAAGDELSVETRVRTLRLVALASSEAMQARGDARGAKAVAVAYDAAAESVARCVAAARASAASPADAVAASRRDAATSETTAAVRKLADAIGAGSSAGAQPEDPRDALVDAYAALDAALAGGRAAAQAASALRARAAAAGQKKAALETQLEALARDVAAADALAARRDPGAQAAAQRARDCAARAVVASMRAGEYAAEQCALAKHEAKRGALADAAAPLARASAAAMAVARARPFGSSSALCAAASRGMDASKAAPADAPLVVSSADDIAQWAAADAADASLAVELHARVREACEALAHGSAADEEAVRARVAAQLRHARAQSSSSDAALAALCASLERAVASQLSAPRVLEASAALAHSLGTRPSHAELVAAAVAGTRAAALAANPTAPLQVREAEQALAREAAALRAAAFFEEDDAACRALEVAAAGLAAVVSELRAGSVDVARAAAVARDAVRAASDAAAALPAAAQLRWATSVGDKKLAVRAARAAADALRDPQARALAVSLADAGSLEELCALLSPIAGDAAVNAVIVAGTADRVRAAQGAALVPTARQLDAALALQAALARAGAAPQLCAPLAAARSAVAAAAAYDAGDDLAPALDRAVWLAARVGAVERIAAAASDRADSREDAHPQDVPRETAALLCNTRALQRVAVARADAGAEAALSDARMTDAHAPVVRLACAESSAAAREAAACFVSLRQSARALAQLADSGDVEGAGALAADVSADASAQALRAHVLRDAPLATPGERIAVAAALAAADRDVQALAECARSCAAPGANAAVAHAMAEKAACALRSLEAAVAPSVLLCAATEAAEEALGQAAAARRPERLRRAAAEHVDYVCALSQAAHAAAAPPVLLSEFCKSDLAAAVSTLSSAAEGLRGRSADAVECALPPSLGCRPTHLTHRHRRSNARKALGAVLAASAVAAWSVSGRAARSGSKDALELRQLARAAHVLGAHVAGARDPSAALDGIARRCAGDADAWRGAATAAERVGTACAQAAGVADADAAVDLALAVSDAASRAMGSSGPDALAPAMSALSALACVARAAARGPEALAGIDRVLRDHGAALEAAACGGEPASSVSLAALRDAARDLAAASARDPLDGAVHCASLQGRLAGASAAAQRANALGLTLLGTRAVSALPEGSDGRQKAAEALRAAARAADGDAAGLAAALVCALAPTTAAAVDSARAACAACDSAGRHRACAEALRLAVVAEAAALRVRPDAAAAGIAERVEVSAASVRSAARQLEAARGAEAAASVQWAACAGAEAVAALRELEERAAAAREAEAKAAAAASAADPLAAEGGQAEIMEAARAIAAHVQTCGAAAGDYSDATDLASCMARLSVSAEQRDGREILRCGRAISAMVRRMAEEAGDVAKGCAHAGTREGLEAQASAARNFAVQLGILCAVKAASENEDPTAKGNLVKCCKGISAAVMQLVSYEHVSMLKAPRPKKP
eukprot:m51a1_g7778 hypothetical protein (3273) ;mRNA; r:208497-218782